jgi:hypothetical protein
MRHDFAGRGNVCFTGLYDFFQYGFAASRHLIDILEGDTVVRACLALGPSWKGHIVPFGIDECVLLSSVQNVD